MPGCCLFLIFASSQWWRRYSPLHQRKGLSTGQLHGTDANVRISSSSLFLFFLQKEKRSKSEKANNEYKEEWVVDWTIQSTGQLLSINQSSDLALAGWRSFPKYAADALVYSSHFFFSASFLRFFLLLGNRFFVVTHTFAIPLVWMTSFRRWNNTHKNWGTRWH